MLLITVHGTGDNLTGAEEVEEAGKPLSFWKRLSSWFGAPAKQDDSSMTNTSWATGQVGPKYYDTRVAPDTHKWWEPGSNFTKSVGVRKGIHPHGELDDLEIIPISWDGKNSLRSRVAAARKLVACIRTAEKARQDYVIVGHSHGGSVIDHAMRFLSRTGEPLPGLKKWITVGTPFLDIQHKILPWAKLNFVSRVFVYAIAAFLMAIAFGFSLPWGDAPDTFLEFLYETVWELKWPTLGPSLVVILSFLWIISSDAVFGRLQNKYLKPYNKRAPNFDQITDSWEGLWHGEDEAINGLQISQRGIKDLVSRTTLLGQWTAVFILTAGWTLFQFVLLSFEQKDVSRTVTRAEGLSWETFQVAEMITLRLARALTGTADLSLPMSVLTLFVILPIAAGLIILFANLISSVTARLLDFAVSGGVKNGVLGLDHPYAKSAHVSPRPDFGRDPTRLGAKIEEGMKAYADSQAASTLANFRKLLGLEEAKSLGSRDLVDAIVNQLTWSELVHTIYFKHVGCRDYIVVIVRKALGIPHP